MAVGPSIPKDVDTFVYPRKTFYPSRIHIQHHQLRHILTSPEPNNVYFTTYNDVYKVDTSTQQKHLVTQLPFEPRCTATGHGYFCAGDEHGYIAFFPLHKSQPTTSATADGPLDGLPNGPLPGFNIVGQGSRGSQNVDFRVEQLGTQIVNSVSIHELHLPGFGSDIVVVSTNNDNSIQMLSLTRTITTKLDDYPFPMNHASISPDGRRMVAVGDKEIISFYKRVDSVSPTGKPYDWSRNFGCHFELQHRFPLHKAVRASHAAYFTTAWSQTGRLCATASEEGFITVFNVDALDGAERVQSVIKAMCPSSRPDTIPGGIRTMAFAPDPWDLLIWTEDHGRVCVGDLRRNLFARQVVKLDSSKDDEANTVHLTTPPKERERPSSRGFDRDTDLVSSQQYDHGDSLLRYLSTTQERRALRDQGSLPDPNDSGLSEEERQILEGLRTTRQREDALQQQTLAAVRRQQDTLHAMRQLEMQSQPTNSRPSPRSISYYPGTRNRHDAIPVSDGRNQTSPSGTSSGSELVRLQQDAAVLGSLRDYMRDSNYLRRELPSSSSRPSQQPQSRNSTVIPSNVHPPSDTPASPSDPWQTIEAAMHRASSRPASYASIVSQDNSNEPIPEDSNHTLLLSELQATNDPPSYSPAHTSTITSPSYPPPRNNESSSGLRNRIGIDAPSLNSQYTSTATAEALERRRALIRDRDALSLHSSTSPTATVGPISRDTDRSSRLANQVVGRYESSLLRRVGVRTAGHQTAVGLRRQFGYHVSAEEAAEWGPATTGAAISEGGRVLYVGTEEGIWVLDLDFGSRKGLGKIEPA